MRLFPSVAVVALMFATACERAPQTAAPATTVPSPEGATAAGAGSSPSLSAPGESIVTEYNLRIKEYMALHKKLDSTLKWPDRATPQQIDTNQRALGALIAKARSDAKVGDVFTTEMQTFVRGLVRHVIERPGGATVKSSIMDENPQGLKLQINGRYPDSVPLSTMPPDMLAALPTLPEELEYRFVGDRLILLDTKGHIIIDIVENVIPK